MRILAAVDGSKCSLSAVKQLVLQARWYRELPRVELVTAVLPVPPVRGLGGVVGRDQLRRYYREEGEAALAPARKLLRAARIPHVDHILVGQPAESVVDLASRRKCDLIVIGANGRTAIGNALLGSVATKILRLSGIPVQLVR